MTSTFYNRLSELESIADDSRNNGFVVLKGRHRIGKTRLIQEWAKRFIHDHASLVFEQGYFAALIRR